MARKLVVCCDGTWNDEASQSNVFRTYQRLREETGNPAEEVDGSEGWRVSCSAAAVLFYDDGVGSKFWDRVIGGATGVGLSRNVCQAYQFLCREYRAGDEIYIFGFSRGAYTARSLSGFIGAAGGLLPTARGSAIAKVYLEKYVARDRMLAAGGADGITELAAKLDLREGDGAQAQGQATRPVRVRFLGVYDTVGALGVPTPILTKLIGPVVRFHDTRLGAHIDHAVHALAVDERRPPFAPTLWTLAAGDKLRAGQSCLQVWFPGVHSDVGGGYADRGIADLTLDFMMRRAAERGLAIDPSRLVGAHPWCQSELQETPGQHDSFGGFWSEFSSLFDGSSKGVSRPIGDVQRLARDIGSEQVAGREMLHPCLVRRWRQQVRTLPDDGKPGGSAGLYEPGSLSWPQEVDQRRPGDVPVFMERADGIRLPTEEATSLSGRPCRVLDRSPRGARVQIAPSVKVGTPVKLGSRSGTVVWTAGDQAGLRLQAA